MKRNKVTQLEVTKHPKREARAREFLDRLGVYIYQSFGKICVDGLLYPDYQTAARFYDPEWYRRSQE